MKAGIVAGICIGGGIGFAVGYFGKCASGTCPLTSNYYVSTVIGAVIGLLLAMARS
jgi:hypothetical protein